MQLSQLSSECKPAIAYIREMTYCGQIGKLARLGKADGALALANFNVHGALLKQVSDFTGLRSCA
ncbi:MAG: hypothetical protein F6K28_28535 [Microcoleus sp. SIO2G3]|nr:hypothetical protein [Microcoleus sp. SIO2G3]